MLRCAITPGELAFAGDARRRALALSKLVARGRELAADGVDLLLVREKDLAVGELLELVREVVQAGKTYAVKVLVARRVDVAMAAGSAGVHLSSCAGELTPAQVRQVMPAAFVSVSCHTLDEVRRAAGGQADAVLFAPVFNKCVGGRRVARGVGLEALAQAVAAAGDVPVFALGGVTSSFVPACRAAGAEGVAGIRLFFS